MILAAVYLVGFLGAAAYLGWRDGFNLPTRVHVAIALGWFVCLPFILAWLAGCAVADRQAVKR